MKQTNCLDIHSFLKIYFITISRLKFAKFLRIIYILRIKPRLRFSCVRASVNTMQFYDITVLKCLYGQQGFYSFGSSIPCKKVF